MRSELIVYWSLVALTGTPGELHAQGILEETEVIEEVVVGSSLEFFDQITVFIAKPKLRPRVILVFGTNFDDPKSPLSSPQWRELAQELGMGFVALGFQEKRGIVNRKPVAAELSKHLLSTMDERFGEDVKLVGVVSGKGGHWLHQMMHVDSSRWGFWYCKDTVSFPFTSPGMSYPAGLLVSTLGDQHASNQRFAEAIRASNRSNRVTFLRADRENVPNGYFIRFFQDYLRSVFEQGAASKGLWYNSYDERQIAVEEGKFPDPKVSWLPNEEIAATWRLLNQEKRQPSAPLIVAKAVEVERNEQKKELSYLVRIPNSIREGGAARGVMLFLSWQQDEEAFQKVFRNRYDPRMQLADDQGLVVVGWNVAPVWTKEGSPHGSIAAELEAASSRMQELAPYWWMGIQRLCQANEWPLGDFLFYAERSAGYFAHHLVFTRPHLCLAVNLHQCGNPPLSKDAASAMWLITTGSKHPAALEARKLFNRTKNLEWGVLFKQHGGTEGHDSWPLRILTARFFEHALKIQQRLTDPNIGFLLKLDSPVNPQPSLNEEVIPSHKIPGSAGYFLWEQQQKPFLIGHMNQGRAYSPDEGDLGEKVPPGAEVRLPNWFLAEGWMARRYQPPKSEIEPAKPESGPVGADHKPSSTETDASPN